MIYKEYLESEHWKKLREKVKQRDGYQCQDCGATPEELAQIDAAGLEVHHKFYDHLLMEEEIDDCITLCNFCHRDRHRGVE